MGLAVLVAAAFVWRCGLPGREAPAGRSAAPDSSGSSAGGGLGSGEVEPPARSDARSLNVAEAMRRLVEVLRHGDLERAREALLGLYAAAAPPPLRGSRNAATLYLEAFKRWGEGFTLEEEEAFERLLGGEELSPSERERLEAAVERGKDILALLEEAESWPECRFEIDFSQGFKAEVPYLFRASKDGDLLLANGLLKGEASAMQGLRALHRMARGLGNQPL